VAQTSATLLPEWIVIHSSAAPWGGIKVINEWHNARGFRRKNPSNGLAYVGYHAIIENGHEKSSYGAQSFRNGIIAQGRDDCEYGAHAWGLNAISLGVCLVGKDGQFTNEQITSLICYVISKQTQYRIPIENVIGHYETPHEQSKSAAVRKTCPDIDMEEFRDVIERCASDMYTEMICIPPEVISDIG